LAHKNWSYFNALQSKIEEIQNLNLIDLPRITRQSQTNGRVTVLISPIPTIENDVAACIFDGKEFFIYGVLHPPKDSSCFIFEIPTGYGEIVFPEDQLYIFDTYWTERIELALSDSIKWNKSNFTKDGIVNFYTNEIIRNSKGILLDSNFVRQQLDHEHCSICWKTIDYSDPIVYHARSYEYLCEVCWNNFKQKKNINFFDSLGDFA